MTEQRKAADCEKVLETNSFKACYKNTLSNEDITQAETAWLEGLFRDACQSPCELDITIELTRGGDCTTYFGEGGTWVDVTYTVSCVEK